MGWTFECSSSRLKDFLNKRRSGWDWTDEKSGLRHTAKCLASKYVMQNPGKGVLWKVMESTRYTPDGKVEHGPERWIGMDLIRWGGGKDSGWGYKDMEESSGPGEISCPLKYLEMVPNPHSCACVPKPEPNWPDRMEPGCSKCWSAQWRKKVRVYHDQRRATDRLLRRLQVGDRVYLTSGFNPKWVVITSVKPLKTNYGKINKRWVDVTKTIGELGVT